MKGLQMRKLLSVLLVFSIAFTFVGQVDAITRVGSGYVLSDGEITNFREQTNAERLNVWNISSPNGLSLYRDKVDTGNTGTVLDNEDQSTDTGYILVASGSNANGTAVLKTRRRGSYIPGATGIYGIGFHRNGSSPTGNQFFEAGAFDSSNGVGFGEDSQGKYVFWRNTSDTNKIYQSNWNQDTLDGSGDSNNPSGFDIDYGAGIIGEIYINFYGEGPTEFKVLVPDTADNKSQLVTIHEINNENMIVHEPNLPIKAKVDNNGEASDLEVAVGGRQFSLLSGRYEPTSRPGSESVYSYQLTASQGEWEPIMSITKEDSRNQLPNSLNIEFIGATLLNNEDVAYRVTYGGTTDIGSYQGSPDNIPDDESGMKTYDSQDFTAGVDDGGVVLRDLSASGSKASGTSSEESSIVLGNDIEVTLWVRPLTANTTTVSAFMKWREFF